MMLPLYLPSSGRKGKFVGEHNFEHNRCQLGRRQAERMSYRIIHRECAKIRAYFWQNCLLWPGIYSCMTMC